MIPEGNPISKFRHKATQYFTIDVNKYQALWAKTRNKTTTKSWNHNRKTCLYTHTNARNRTSIQKRPAWPQQPNLYLEPKWLRWLLSTAAGSNSPSATMCDCARLAATSQAAFLIVFPNEYSLRHPNYSYPQSLPSTLLYIGFSLATYKEALLSQETYKALQLTNIVTWMRRRCPSMQWVVGSCFKNLEGVASNNTVILSSRPCRWCKGAAVKADSTLRSSRAVPHPSTNRALRRLTSEVRRDPVYSTRYGRQRMWWLSLG